MVETTNEERFDDVLAFLESVGDIDGSIVHSYSTTAENPSHTTVTVEVSVFHD